MALTLGIKGYLQFAREGTYGTAAAATHRVGFEECTLEAKPQIGETANMPAAGFASAAWMRDMNNQGQFVAGEHTEGQITLPLDYDGLLQFFDMAMGTGTYGTYGATVSGAGPYLHTFGPEKEALNSATLEWYEGGVAANARLTPGCKLRGLTIRGAAAGGDAGVLRMVLDVVGQKTSYASPTAGQTAITRVPILFSHCNSWTDGDRDQSNGILREFEFSIKNELAAPQYVFNTTGQIREPVRDGLITTTLKMTREYTSNALTSKFSSGGKMSAPPIITFASGTKNFGITFNAASIIAQPQPRPALKGIMLIETTYKALWSGPTDGGVTLTMTSAQNGAAA